MDYCDRLLDHSITAVDSVLLRPVRKTADVYDVDGRDVPDWMGYHVSAAGPCLLWVGHVYWPGEAAVWV